MKDFLILYEHKTRELENCCLLAAELEKRGYSVGIHNLYCRKQMYLRSKVLLVPHLYDESQVLQFGNSIFPHPQKIIDLQYEQVLRENQHNSLHDPSGRAKGAQHIAWGNAQKERYLRGGIDVKNIHVTGHIGMDLDSVKFDDMFFSREQIGKKLRLDTNKEWILFISTFAYKMMTKEEIDAFVKVDPSIELQVNLSLNAQSTILRWLTGAARENPNKIIIYRRHPSEREDIDIKQLELQYDNFRCIDDYTMRQWVRVSDVMYTWYSTSIADAYYANKKCLFLRPEPLDYEYELDIAHEAKFITTYTEFIYSLSNIDSFEFPIPDATMKEYYGKTATEEQYAYLRLADVCEKIFRDDTTLYDFEIKKIRKKIWGNNAVYYMVNLLLHGLIFSICKHIRIKVPFCMQSSRIIKKITYYNKEGYGEKKYIAEKINSFKKII